MSYIIIMIMYIYHMLINALSTNIIHINHDITLGMFKTVKDWTLTMQTQREQSAAPGCPEFWILLSLLSLW